MTPSPESTRQDTREQCYVGDYVPVELIPEWKGETAPQEFRTRCVDLSPMLAGIGGAVPAAEMESWIFRWDTNTRPEGPVWVRVS